MAAALDAADGVMDGRFFGRPIVQQQQFATAPQFSHFQNRNFVSAQPVFGGQSFGQFGSFPGYATSSVVPYAASTPYVQSAPAFSSYASPVSSFASYGGGNSALNLDAADGVIDGKFFGRNIVQSSPSFPAQSVFGGFPTSSVYSSFPQQFATAPAFSSYPQQFAPQFTQFAQPQFAQPYASRFAPQYSAAPQFFSGGNSALALDAADGVIDGKFFGSNIVGAPRPSYIPSAFPAQSFSSFPQSYPVGGFAPRAIAAPHSFLPSTSPMGQSNAALALDAADGVIDGRFHGRRIVQGGPSAYPQYQRGPSAQAQALDAADGVIDGRFHGRPIVERR